jgi:hypothetical protein
MPSFQNAARSWERPVITSKKNGAGKIPGAVGVEMSGGGQPL